MLRLKELREERNITQKELADKLYLTNKSICAYEKNLANPKIDTLIELADFFGCSIDYLVGRETEDSIIVVSGDNFDENEKKLIDLFRQLNTNNRDLLYKIAEALINSNK